MAGTYALNEDDVDAPKGVRRFVPLIIGVVLLIAAGVAMYFVMNTTVGKAKKEPPTMTAMLLPPPPPPPPPPPQEKPPEPVETTKPVPVETPTKAPQKADDAPKAMTMNADAQADGQIPSGDGSGKGALNSKGTSDGPPSSGGISDAFYGRYLSGALQERVENEKKISRQVFTADFNIWIDGSGRVTRAVLARSSGDTSRDAIVQALLEAVRGLDVPPASLRFPQKIAVRGRKSSF